MAVPPGPQGTDLNKAYGAGGTVVIGGALVRVISHFVNTKWPGLIDAETLGDLSMIVAAALAFAGAWLVPHSH